MLQRLSNKIVLSENPSVPDDDGCYRSWLAWINWTSSVCGNAICYSRNRHLVETLRFLMIATPMSFSHKEECMVQRKIMRGPLDKNIIVSVLCWNCESWASGKKVCLTFHLLQHPDDFFQKWLVPLCTQLIAVSSTAAKSTKANLCVGRSSKKYRGCFLCGCQASNDLEQLIPDKRLRLLMSLKPQNTSGKFREASNSFLEDSAAWQWKVSCGCQFFGSKYFQTAFCVWQWCIMISPHYSFLCGSRDNHSALQTLRVQLTRESKETGNWIISQTCMSLSEQ